MGDEIAEVRLEPDQKVSIRLWRGPSHFRQRRLESALSVVVDGAPDLDFRETSYSVPSEISLPWQSVGPWWIRTLAREHDGGRLEDELRVLAARVAQPFGAGSALTACPE